MMTMEIVVTDFWTESTVHIDYQPMAAQQHTHSQSHMHTAQKQGQTHQVKDSVLNSVIEEALQKH